MDRDRLTITLRKSVLAKIDGLIDGTRIRNRSHAIEYLVSQSLSPKVKQAVILAGGKGLHMRPFTYEMPKGLLPVGGRPILEHIVELLRTHEVRDIIFSIGHLGEKIRDHFGDGKKFGVRISYQMEEKSLGTGGALANCRKLLSQGAFLVVHGDILIDIDLSDFIVFHKEQDVVGTLAVTTVMDPSSYGEVILQGSRITNFIEKPEKGKQTSQLVSCGMYLLNHSIFDYLPAKGPSLLETIFPSLAVQKQLGGFLFDGRWVDVGTPQSYERAIREWGISGKALVEP